MGIKSNNKAESYFNFFGASGTDAMAPSAVFSVDSVFSTFLYTGPGSGQSVDNGIDLDGEGGLVWIKNRDATQNHWLLSEDLGSNNPLSSNLTSSASTNVTNWFGADPLYTFNNNGFTLAAQAQFTTENDDYVSWTFRKAEKFFDIVTYSGNATARTIAHNLGCVPGMVIVKSTTADADWFVYNKSVGATYGLLLSETNSKIDSPYWNDTAPTAEVFSVTGAGYNINETGQDYVAYLFADDEDFIKCGTTSSIAGFSTETIELGFKPQFILAKPVTNSGFWLIADSKRGLYTSVSSAAKALFPNETDIESTTYDSVAVHDNGFILKDWTGSTGSYLYMAIKE